MYDRLVHFAFGFLLAVPVREGFVVLANVKGFWSYYFPLDVTLSLSAVYEIIEWATVQVVQPGAGLAFLGTQGDEWDTQKDMAAAGTGALLAMVFAASAPTAPARRASRQPRPSRPQDPDREYGTATVCHRRE
jgi:putative membrane protein